MSGPFYECDRCRRKLEDTFTHVSMKEVEVQISPSTGLQNMAGLGYDLCADCAELLKREISNPMIAADIYDELYNKPMEEVE